MAPRRIGLISDTHGLLRPAASRVLEGSDLIIHAGDVGKPGVLEELKNLAPVVAVRGTVALGDWAESLPASARSIRGFMCCTTSRNSGSIPRRPVFES